MKYRETLLAVLFLVFLIPSGYSEICAEELIFSDTFDDNSNKWSTSAYAGIKDGAYFMNNTESDFYSKIGTSFANGSISADVTWHSGETGFGQGIVFRFRDKNNCYVFLIAPAGYYSLGVFHGEKKYTTLVKWTQAATINVKGTNRLEISMNGDVIEGSVNGFSLFSVTDNHHQEGEFGFYASKGVDSRFDNIKVYKFTTALNQQNILPPLVTLSGKVMKNSRGRQNIEVRVYRMYDIDSRKLIAEKTVKTGADGSFSFTVPEGFLYFIDAGTDRKKKSADYASTFVDTTIGNDVTNLILDFN